LNTAYKDLGLDPAEIANIRNHLPRRWGRSNLLQIKNPPSGGFCFDSYLDY
jgi:hypothetical protein